MKLTLTLALVSMVSSATISNDTPSWHPPGPHDVRGPCPMLNALANHGLLPRDGSNITKERAVSALTGALNFDEALAVALWSAGMFTSPNPKGSHFTMMDLRRHNVIEHDASMSRQDAYFGNNFDFNQTIFDGSKAFFTDETLDRQQLANSKLYRQLHSKAHNATYVFNDKTDGLSLGEHTAPFIAFGDLDAITVRRDWTVYFFENERLPYSLGWRKREARANLTDFNRMKAEISKSETLTTANAFGKAIPDMIVQSSLSGLDPKLSGKMSVISEEEKSAVAR